MDKKSFWRGFGIGVLFATLILGASYVVRTSDSQVIARAKKLGMVFASSDDAKTVADTTDTEATDAADGDGTEDGDTATTTDTDDASTAEATAQPDTSTEQGDSGTSSSKASKKSKKKSEKATAAPDTASTTDATGTTTLTEEKEKMTEDVTGDAQTLKIAVGDWSTSVCQQLEKMGIIDDAVDFDKYLNDNGYSTAISAGTYTVSKGDSYDTLARKITEK